VQHFICWNVGLRPFQTFASHAPVSASADRSTNGPFWKAENAKADLGGDVGHPLREILTGQMPFDVPDVCVSTKKVLSPQDMLGQTLLQ